MPPCPRRSRIIYAFLFLSISLSEPASDIAVFGHYAEEDPELCAQCAGEAGDDKRWACRSGKYGGRTGSGARQTGSQGGVPA